MKLIQREAFQLVHDTCGVDAGEKEKNIANLGGEISSKITMLAHTFSTDKYI